MTTYQQQNEALVRLMIMAKYQDRRISLSEDKAFRQVVDALKWESGTSPDIFVDNATAEVRDALSSGQSKAEFLTAQCAVFDTPKVRRYVLERLGAMLKADGLDPRENEFLQMVQEALGLGPE